MTGPDRDFVSDIGKRVGDAAGVPPSEVEAHVERPKDPKLGDFAFPCFQLAKRLKKAPVAIAQEIAAKVREGIDRNVAEALEAKLEPLLQSVEAVGPYMNFRVAPAKFARDVLTAIEAEGDRYGGSGEGAGRAVVIDYSSPNIAKRFHIGHLRSTVFGGALCRIYAALGYKPVGVNHLGDWGTQFGHLMAAWKRSGDETALSRDAIGHLTDLYVRQNKAAKEDAAVEGEGRAWFRRLEEGDPEARALWKRFREVSIQEFQRIYELLEVTFDSISGESFYEDKMPAAIRLSEEKGVAETSQGALVVDLEKRGQKGLAPFMLRKSDGATTYATRDLAAALYRLETYDAARLLYVVGLPQRDHLRQLAAVLTLLGLPGDRVMHVGFGHVLGMSTREGPALLLDEVLGRAIEMARTIVREKSRSRGDTPLVPPGPELSPAEIGEVARAVGMGAIIFNDLKNARVKDIEFDWERMLSFDGDTGPYLQYTHVRLCGIIRKHEAAGGRLATGADVDHSLLGEPETVAVLKLLASYPERVALAARDNEPSAIARHLLELASALNTFYHEHRVVGERPELERARLLLVDCVRRAIGNGLRLLGIKPLERM